VDNVIQVCVTRISLWDTDRLDSREHGESGRTLTSRQQMYYFSAAPNRTMGLRVKIMVSIRVE